MYTPLRFTQMNRPVQSRYSDVQDVLSKTLYDVCIYAVFAFIVGGVLEYVFPKYSPVTRKSDKETFMILLEVIVQILLIVFAFMYISSLGGGRYGLLVYTIFMLGTQPTLLKKIGALYQRIFDNNENIVQKSINKENYVEKKEVPKQVKNNMSTSLDDLPII